MSPPVPKWNLPSHVVAGVYSVLQQAGLQPQYLEQIGGILDTTVPSLPPAAPPAQTAEQGATGAIDTAPSHPCLCQGRLALGYCGTYRQESTSSPSPATWGPRQLRHDTRRLCLSVQSPQTYPRSCCQGSSADIPVVLSPWRRDGAAPPLSPTLPMTPHPPPSSGQLRWATLAVSPGGCLGGYTSAWTFASRLKKSFSLLLVFWGHLTSPSFWAPLLFPHLFCADTYSRVLSLCEKRLAPLHMLLALPAQAAHPPSSSESLERSA